MNDRVLKPTRVDFQNPRSIYLKTYAGIAGTRHPAPFIYIVKSDLTYNLLTSAFFYKSLLLCNIVNLRENVFAECEESMNKP